MVAMVVFDVAEEILLRLPAKDLLRYKTVCKLWYSLISSPSFLKTHEKFICNNEDNRRSTIAMRSYRYHSRSWSIEGSSNGLVCLYACHNQIIVTNPLTRDLRRIPKPPRNPNDVLHKPCLGFGYDSSTDDYKLVIAINQSRDHRALIQILSLKSNIWKFFGHVNYRFRDSDHAGILFNGALHWFCYIADGIAREKVLVVSFDLAKEEFIEILLPKDTRYVWNYDNSMGIIEGRLCIFRTENNGRPYDIWVVKNYNVKPSWEQLTDDYVIKDNVVHYMDMITDCDHKKKPAFFCGDSVHPSRDEKYIWSPIFVQTFVSPYSNNGKSSHTKNKNRGVKEKREIDEILLEQGEGGKKKRN